MAQHTGTSAAAPSPRPARTSRDRVVRAAAVLLVAGLALTGCSGDGDDSSPAPTASATATSAGSSSPTGKASPTTSAAPPATTPVPPPTPGSTESTVASREPTVRKPVRLDADGEAADGVTVRLARVTSLRVKAVAPGEVTGPGLALTVSITNGTSGALDLGTVSVNVTGADSSAASQMTGKPSDPVTGSLKPGKKASGVYVFTVAKGQRNPLTVEVSVRPEDPVVVFRGRAAS